ncbi:MAG: FAD-dependent oxidoreductase [Methylophilaceae bacterium]|nr:NAD(P)/FAD-dependent oxidoreductase [Methyloradius sp.]
MSQHPTIAIIGGGPGGLTLARILYLHGIVATVFESDAHPLARPQGGSLDMHEETGQYALHLAGLEDTFRSFARYEDQGDKVYSPDGTLLAEKSGQDDNRPEIDRTQLRQLLLDSLPDGMVRWNQKVKSIQRLADNRSAVVTSEDQEEVFNLVVGADGAWSRVRALVSDAVPFYEGVTIAELGIDEVDTKHPEIARLIGHGKIFSKGNGKTLIAQRNDYGHIRVYAALRIPENSLNIDIAKPERAKEVLESEFSEFAPELINLITTGKFIGLRPMYALPIGHRWNNQVGVTLIGDAAHLMSPFSGEGANSAMIDAADLAMSLVQKSDWVQAVKDYEDKMFPRAEVAASGAAEGLRGGVSVDG